MSDARADNERDYPPMTECGPDISFCGLRPLGLPGPGKYRDVKRFVSCPNHADVSAAGRYLADANKNMKRRVEEVIRRKMLAIESEYGSARAKPFAELLMVIKDMDDGLWRDAKRRSDAK